jgi:hypothetical protein
MEWTKKQLYDKVYYLAHKSLEKKEKTLKTNKEWRKKNVNRTLYTSAKNRSRRKGIEFNLELSDIVVPIYCPVLNLPLAPNQEGTQKYKQNSPTLDRIDPTLGYTKGNVQVISHLANSMKNNASAEQLRTFALWVNKTYGK